MIIENLQVTDTSLEKLVRQSLQDQMAGIQLSPAIRERIWRRIMAWAACDGEADAGAEMPPTGFCLEESHLA
jgi:chorismate mutase